MMYVWWREWITIVLVRNRTTRVFEGFSLESELFRILMKCKVRVAKC